MATKATTGKKKPSTKKPASKKSATPKPVPVPVENPAEETKPVNVTEELTKMMCMNYLEIFGSTILNMKPQICQSVINALYVIDENEASEEYKEALQNVAAEANSERDIRIFTYEAIETLAMENSVAAKNDPATYLMIKEVKSKLKGYGNDDISIEGISPVPGSNIMFLVFKESLITSLAASENLIKSMGDDAVCGMCFRLREFPISIMEIFRSYITAMMPSTNTEVLNEMMNKYIEDYGSAIAGIAIRTLATLNNYFNHDPHGNFTSIVGMENIGNYYFKCVVNTTTPEKVSVFEIHKAPVIGDKNIEDAIKEA